MSQATSQSYTDGHVAIFAFPYASHPVPMLNLAVKLAQEASGVRFSFFNTAESNKSLFKSQILPCNLKVYDVEDGVPTGDIRCSLRIKEIGFFLKSAPENLKKALDFAVSETGTKVTCLLTDSILTFAGEFSRNHLNSVPWIAVWSAFPSAFSAYLYTNLIRDRFAGRDREIEDIPLDFVPGLSGMKVGDFLFFLISKRARESLFAQALSQSGIVLRRDCAALVIGFYDYETLSPSGLSQDLKSKFREVLHVGLLTGSTSSSEPDNELMSWLDEQKERSVAYVSFGTVVELPQSEMVALAAALEESNVPFLWSLKDHLKKDLPQGFEERTRLRGKVVSWAPQQQVLLHRSVGVFVNQCGFNSVFESIIAEKPMICRPFWADNFFIARFVEDVWKIGVKLKPKMLTKNDVVNGLDLILGQEEGQMMGKRVTKLKETLLEASASDGSAAQDFKTLVKLVSSRHGSVPM